MSRVLVTGATGFIGRDALRAVVASGREVHAVARGGHAGGDEVRWHDVDLLDSEASASLIARVRPQELLHLAWYTDHRRFWTSPENVRWVEASLALFRAFAGAGGRRAVIAGTCAEYDWAVVGKHDAAALEPPRCSETSSPVNSHTLYGTAKHATHLVTERFAENVGIELAWGRVFFLYGPNEQPGRLVPTVVRSLLRGETVPASDGDQIRDFLHVSDVADGFASLLASDVCGPVNIASGEAVTVRTVIETIARCVGRPELVRWGALERGLGDPDVLLADVARLHHEVGFEPRITLDEGLMTTVDWWRERREG